MSGEAIRRRGAGSKEHIAVMRWVDAPSQPVNELIGDDWAVLN
jgi:hypothetical protein